MIPSPLVMKAQKFRRWYREQVLALFKDVDVILAPATPCTAPAIGQQTFVLDGVEMPVRPNIGIYTQPISFIGSAGGRCAGSAQAAADRRSGHRGAVAGGHRLARGAIPGGHGCGCGTAAAFELMRHPGADCVAPGMTTRNVGSETGMTLEVNLPDVVAEVTAAFEKYEDALVNNKVDILDGLFRDAPQTIRYGATENLYGSEEIQAFRAGRSPVALGRTLSKTVITTYGRDFAVASTLYQRPVRARAHRPADADLGAVPGGLARGRCACQPDGAAETGLMR